MSFKIRVKVLNTDVQPDSEGETIDPEGITLGNGGRVPVFKEFDRITDNLVGWAQLTIEPDGVWAEVESPKELHGGFLCVGGSVTDRRDKILTKTVIRELGWTASANADKRIGPLP